MFEILDTKCDFVAIFFPKLEEIQDSQKAMKDNLAGKTPAGKVSYIADLWAHAKNSQI